MNYTIKSFKKQQNTVHTAPKCTPLSRCHNHKKCEYCHTIWRRKNYTKITSHLTEQSIKQFKYKKYITFKSFSLTKNYDKKNIAVDNFINEFKIMKRNKSFIIDEKSQYVITKEISYTRKLGHNPHYNLILLSNKEFNLNNRQLKKLLDKYEIVIYIDNISKDSKSNKFLTSIKKLVNYSLKFERTRKDLESQIDITKYKRDLFTSEFFDSVKYSILQRKLYIQIKEIKEHYRAELKTAKELFKRNTKKTSPKNYLRLLKSFRKKKKRYKSAQAHYTRLITRRVFRFFNTP